MGRITKKKARKKKKAKGAPRFEKPLPRGLTPNGKRIYEMMQSNKVRGSWKDWVLFVGPQMIERYGTYTVAFKPDENPENDKEASTMMALVHKRKLTRVVNPDFGALFWDSKRHARTNYGAPPAQKAVEK